MERRCGLCYKIQSISESDECEKRCETLSSKERCERRNENLRWYPLREGEVTVGDMLRMVYHGTPRDTYSPLRGFEKDSFERAKVTLSEAFAKYCPKMKDAGFCLSFRDIAPHHLTAIVHMSANLCFAGRHLTTFWKAWTSSNIYFISSSRMKQLKVNSKIRRRHVPRFFKIFESRMDAFKNGEDWDEPPTYEFKGERVTGNYISRFGNLFRFRSDAYETEIYDSEFFGMFGEHDFEIINSGAKLIYDTVRTS